MTLEEINELVDEIQQLLMSETDPSEEELMDLAGRHEDRVSVAAKRLKAVESLLNRGLRSEAIELAEREPNLNEVVIALDFPELDAWNELLARFEMQPIPALPADVAAELNDAYGTSAPVEKLLQRHRGAAIARAPLVYRIDILRRLCAADGANPIWPRDVKSFELQRLSDIKSELDFAIREQNAATLAALDQELASPDWRNAVPADLRRKATDAHARIRQVTARKEMDEIAYQLSNAYADFDIDTARQLGQRFEALAQIVKLSGNDPLLNVAGPALDWLREEQTKVDREQRFQTQLDAIEEALNRTTTIEELERLYYGVTQHGQALPERLENRLSDRLETLKVNAVRRRRSIIAASATAAVVMLAAMGLFIRHIGVRNTISRHVDQLSVLLPEAGKTGLVQPLDEYFQLLEEESSSISRSAELVGLRKQFETLKLAETARVAQIEQLLADALSSKNEISSPAGFPLVFEVLEKASLLTKNTAEKSNVLIAESAIRKRQSELQQTVDEEFGVILKDVTAAVAELPVDSTSEYDGMLVRLSELENAEQVSNDLKATVTALRSKVLAQRSEVSMRLEVARSLQLITDSVGQVPGFATQLQKYVEAHPGSSRSADFQTVLESEKILWSGAIAWNGIRSKLLAVDIASISPLAAKTLVDDYAAFQKSSGPYCGETLLGDRLIALQAVAKRKMGSDGTFAEQFRPVFEGKAITASFLIEATAKNERYYADAPPQIDKNLSFDYFTTPSGDQTIAKVMSATLFTDADKKSRNDWLSPQSRMTNAVFERVQTSKSADFERTVTEITKNVLDEPKLDPILRLLLAERMLTIGSEGSGYIAASSEKILNEIAGSGIPRLTNWVDFQDKDVKKQRDTATAFLEQSAGDIVKALQTAEMTRDASKSSKIGPAVRWIGWLCRDERTDWRVSMKAETSLVGGTRLCIFQKSSPTAPATMVEVATVSAEGMVTLSEQVSTSAIEGRPVFQILDE